ncbi:MAG: Coenzyme F420 hydrogenase/dehydrogenase, beta subunit C-terminal domain [Proteobacteria bacterium]|nr:Coenzyme F420 hydrogenase/dehydrogenase, beta subunit C-terminal domain [Pseudomonadota bacterium]
MLEDSFDGLKKRVIDTKLCFFCGQCCAVCSTGCISFKDNGPELDGECVSCGQCLEACPGLGSPLKKLDIQVFGRETTPEEEAKGLGIYLSDRNLVSADKEIQGKGYTGGKLTATLAYLLEKKEIDAAIVSQWGAASPYAWVSWPVIATTREEIIKGAGSKYVFSPNLMALSEIADREDIKSVAIVGLGCHMQGLRKLELLGQSYAALAKKVKYSFGLYCGSPMRSKEDFMTYVANMMGVSVHDIATVDFKRVSKEFDIAFDIVLKNGENKVKQMNIMQLFEVIGPYQRWHRCKFCTDYAAEYADISFGGSHITCRTPKGEDLIDQVVADGWLVPSEPNGLMDQMAISIDQTMAKTKKVANVQRIIKHKSDGKPVPSYD